jgi:hypothetical protein
MNRDLLPRARYKRAVCLISVVLTALAWTGCQQAGPQTYDLRVPAMLVTFDHAGAMQQIGFTGSDSVRRVRAFTWLRDCEPEGSVNVTQSDSVLSFQRKWVSRANGNSALVTDRFSRGNGSVRWEVEVAGLQGPWSTPILDCMGRPQAGRHTEPITESTDSPRHSSLGCFRKLE